MTDNGSAETAAEVTEGLVRLGILHETTLPYSPYQNAKQEVFWAQIEGRLLPMLEDVEPLTLELLNDATFPWVEMEYNRSLHRELGCSPLKRFLEGPDVARESPDADSLRRTFRATITRTQRRSDGTCTVLGTRFEVPSRYRHLPKLRLRYARWDLQSIDLVDPHTEAPVATLYPLDKHRNAEQGRRALEPVAHEPIAPPPGENAVAPLLRRLIADYAATGLPPAYLPFNPDEE
ncbi:MAG: IS481 family transposase, partial [Thermoanaerobaculales bacterium]